MSYDSAGRLSGVSGTADKSYANSFSYMAAGAIGVMKLGNDLWEHTLFNSRLQPREIGLGTSSTDSSKLKLTYGYGTTANNGNVLSQAIAIGPTTMAQTYEYDELNRLKSVTEGSTWSQTYSYDRYGTGQ
jgi:hypothetical protein